MSVDTLGDALPREIARVRDEVLPEYLAIGPPGQLAAGLMRLALDRASQAMIQGDTVAMIAAYEDLKGYTL
jgi:hypothetical protein